MRHIKLNLREFLKDAYDYNLSESVDPENFWFEHYNYEKEDELINAVKEKYSLSQEDAERTIQYSQERKYEDTYIESYYSLVKSELEDKITEDFYNLDDFFGDELEDHKVKGGVYAKVDFDKNELIISGHLSSLDVIIFEVLRGIGWNYGDLKTFKEDCGKNVKVRFESHTHILKQLEDVYGSIFNFFDFKVSRASDYLYGDIDLKIDEEYIEDAIDYIGLNKLIS